jgi:hypothetical protein
MVARYVRDVEVPGSNPGSPTRIFKRGTVRCPSSYLLSFGSYSGYRRDGEIGSPVNTIWDPLVS